MSEWITSDGPDDHCFGCGQRNDHGLKLRFRRTEDGGVETLYASPPHYRGPDGIVHGGIQATLLDEVMGMAIHVGDGGMRVTIVTAEFRLRYRRPVRVGAPLRVLGRVVRTEGPNFFVEGEITDEDGNVLTQAEARWKRID